MAENSKTSTMLFPLLNKIPCLDKGYAALVSSTNDILKLRDVICYVSSKGRNKELDIAYLTLLIKCPLFVQLHLSQYNLTIMNTTLTENLEAYVPNESEIKAEDLDTSRLISDDMRRTTEALMINPNAYRADGCDNFISQVLTPINVYTTLLVHGSRRTWLNFIESSNLPAPIEIYREAVNDIYKSEFEDGSRV